MVPPPGLEPGRTRREILSLLCLPIPPWRHGAGDWNRTNDPFLTKEVQLPTVLHQRIGTLSQIRTDTLLLLRESPLPIGLQGHGTSKENRTPISRLSGATGYKSAVLPLNYRGIHLVVRVGFEPTDPLS